jgi:hypothetical protein
LQDFFFVNPSFGGKFKFSAFSQHDPPTHECLLHSLVLGCVGEYFRATHALAPFSPAPISSNTTLIFTALHLDLDGYFLFFLKDYEPDRDLKFSSDYFKLALQHMSHLLASGFSRMVFEHLCFHLEHLINGYPQLFQV